jgi:hypothetical protein
MTKTTITCWFISAVVLFVALIACGVIISITDATPNRVVFSTYKDLMPLAIAIVAAWLGFCVQRRSAYLQHLRTIWSKLVDAVQSASQFTHLAKPTQENYSQTLVKMSVAVDEIRGVFCNLRESDLGGLYPFEPIKTIHDLIVELKYGDNFQVANTEATRRRIFALWKDVRTELLKEFDREVPTWHHSHWADAEKGRVYDDHGIPKKAT